MVQVLTRLLSHRLLFLHLVPGASPPSRRPRPRCHADLRGASPRARPFSAPVGLVRHDKIRVKPASIEKSPSLSKLQKYCCRDDVTLRARYRHPPSHALLAFRLQAPLGSAEVTTVAESLEEALSVLQASGAEARCQVLDTSLIVALASPSVAQLWACVTEAILEGQAGVESAASILNQVVTIASPAASAIFTLAALEL